jgi:S-formylglutathione hydrolase FrmB
MTVALALPVIVPAAAAEPVDPLATVASDTDADAGEGQGNTPRAESGNIAPPAGSRDADLDPGPAPERQVLAEEVNPDVPGLPGGVEVTRIEWMEARWARVSITSPAMKGEVQKVQIHLARDWYSSPQQTFPSIWMLGGMWGSDKENGWSYKTKIMDFFADKNVNLVLPVGGSGSFYSDWEQPDNGQYYQWETFLTKELPPVLAHWRTQDDHRAIVGLSMGGTSAFNLAARNPDMFDSVGSFSGYLDTTSPGMPLVLANTMKGAGFDATKMWGPYYSKNWREHDPKLSVRNLRGKLLYVSSGTGFPGNNDKPDSLPNEKEMVARMSSQTFANSAALSGVDVHTVWRPNGTHKWPYWEYEMTQMWPLIAERWGMPAEDTAANCTVEGKFKEALDRGRRRDLGDCITNAYNGPDGGQIQDFQDGRIFLAPGSDTAYAQWGRTGALYSSMGGPESWLGYPLREEGRLENGVWVKYEHGRIHHTSAYGTFAVKNDIVDAWGRKDYEHGLGYPTSAETGLPGGGARQNFEHGVIFRSADGKVASVEGEIGDRYLDELGGPAGPLGFPTNDQKSNLVNDGSYSRFERGLIYNSPTTGIHLMYRGPVYEAWRNEGFEHADGLGYPTEDEVIHNDGSRDATFERGSIHVSRSGEVTVTRTGQEGASDIDPDNE